MADFQQSDIDCNHWGHFEVELLPKNEKKTTQIP